MTELSAETDTNERRDVIVLASHSARITRRIQTIERKPLYNNVYNKCYELQVLFLVILTAEDALIIHAAVVV